VRVLLKFVTVVACKLKANDINRITFRARKTLTSTFDYQLNVLYFSISYVAFRTRITHPYQYASTDAMRSGKSSKAQASV